MSTPANIYIFDGEECVGAMHCQSDGHPSGVGKQIADFLSSRKITDGIGDYYTDCNGPDNILPMLTYEMQATRLAQWKKTAKRTGSHFPNKLPAGCLYSLDTRKPFGYTTYNYHVAVDNDFRVSIGVYDDEKHVLFVGSILEFSKFCERAS